MFELEMYINPYWTLPYTRTRSTNAAHSTHPILTNPSHPPAINEKGAKREQRGSSEGA